jgi:hypothetical protein
MEKYRVEIDGGKTICWYKWDTNKLHRLDGPAIEWPDGSKVWLVDGKRHRTDGPAIEYADGHKKWYVDGKQLTEKQWKAAVNKNNCIDKTITIDGKKYKLTEI